MQHYTLQPDGDGRTATTRDASGGKQVNSEKQQSNVGGRKLTAHITTYLSFVHVIIRFVMRR
jgi:hypothetical protein